MSDISVSVVGLSKLKNVTGIQDSHGDRCALQCWGDCYPSFLAYTACSDHVCVCKERSFRDSSIREWEQHNTEVALFHLDSSQHTNALCNQVTTSRCSYRRTQQAAGQRSPAHGAQSHALLFIWACAPPNKCSLWNSAASLFILSSSS